MKKYLILILAFTLYLVPSAYGYTVDNSYRHYYNQTTASIGETDVLDVGDTYIEYMYFNIHANIIQANETIRLVFSNKIPTLELTPISTISQNIKVTISFYNTSHQVVFSDESLININMSFSYYENNMNSSVNISNIDYFTIKISQLPIGYDELLLAEIFYGAIVVSGNSQIINQTISTTQYNNGWSNAMNSKVTQIWSLWNNIFDTFMGVFNVFSIKLMGDITIGHLALVPLVLGLIGFIYALGGKRGR